MLALVGWRCGVSAIPSGLQPSSTAATVMTAVPTSTLRTHPVYPYRVWCPLAGCGRYVAWDRGVRGDTTGIDEHLVNFHRADPEQIVDYDEPSRYKCLDCQASCKSYARFIYHGKNHHCIRKNPIGKPYKCELCPGYVAFKPLELTHHLLEKHVRGPVEGVEPRNHEEAVEENRRLRPSRMMLYNDFGRPWLPLLNSRSLIDSLSNPSTRHIVNPGVEVQRPPLCRKEDGKGIEVPPWPCRNSANGWPVTARPNPVGSAPATPVSAVATEASAVVPQPGAGMEDEYADMPPLIWSDDETVSDGGCAEDDVLCLCEVLSSEPSLDEGTDLDQWASPDSTPERLCFIEADPESPDAGQTVCVDVGEANPESASAVESPFPSEPGTSLKRPNFEWETGYSRRWRSDLRCTLDGDRDVAADGRPVHCNPDGPFPCCMPSGMCGAGGASCTCRDCMDYSVIVANEQRWREAYLAASETPTEESGSTMTETTAMLTTADLSGKGFASTSTENPGGLGLLGFRGGLGSLAPLGALLCVFTTSDGGRRPRRVRRFFRIPPARWDAFPPPDEDLEKFMVMAVDGVRSAFADYHARGALSDVRLQCKVRKLPMTSTSG